MALQNSWGQEAVIYLNKEMDSVDLGGLQMALAMLKHQEFAQPIKYGKKHTSYRKAAF